MQRFAAYAPHLLGIAAIAGAIFGLMPAVSAPELPVHPCSLENPRSSASWEQCMAHAAGRL